ncbi:MAPEG family protein [Novosphingobium sp.]|uniref:MAPEG family protein n=1 Tax=Novosphingobium sp. TaxID=1874826 RepID=UPI00286AC60F|nr:MAPEG family protein [Novosphingobium sp.]
MQLPVTSLVAAGCATLLLILAIDTIRHRLRAKVAFGDGGDARLTSASRAHGNLAEHAPIVLIMLGLLEYNQADHAMLLLIGKVFLLGRISHAIGLYAPSAPGKAPIPRQIGVVITFGTIAVLAAMLLVRLV